MVRVRFAPSPTGFLHIGGARTALFNWLYAKSIGGKFILRIEDTDIARSRQEFVDEILQSLAWLGFGWDELYYQSQRVSLYQEHAQRLLSQGKAYTEKIEGKGEAIIYKVNPQKIKVRDLIRGEIEFDSEVIKDQVLIKSDGSATYNFACVVDDALMGISHVIRGDDHISNTPKQVLMYEALGFNCPQFAHLPLIMGMEGGRLSKRTGATAISDYRKMGYLSGALVNYLLLLSWSPGENREVIDIHEATKIFQIKAVNKTAATFDMKKLDWMNNQYIKFMPSGELVAQLVPLLKEAGLIGSDSVDEGYIASLAKLYLERMNTLNDFVERADFFFRQEIVMDPAAAEKFLSQDLSKEFKLFMQRLEPLAVFDAVNTEACFRDAVKELGIEARQLIHPVRVALTGKTVGPGLFEVIQYLGKERVLARLAKWLK